MVDVAADAQVAVQTVYFTFHTKPELLAACYELAVLGDPGASPPPEQAWHVAMIAASTPAASVAHFVKGNMAICERVAVLDDMVRAAVHEPEAVAVHELQRWADPGRRSAARPAVPGLCTPYTL
jgi:hypothetical protein